MKNFKGLLLFFAFFGFVMDSFAEDFLDRLDVRQISMEEVSSMGLEEKYISNIKLMISDGINENALSMVLPIEVAQKKKLLVLKDLSDKSLAGLWKKLKILEDSEIDSIDLFNEQVANLKKAIMVENSINTINAKKLKQISQILNAAHEAMMDGETNFEDESKFSPRDVKCYRKMLKIVRLTTYMYSLSSVYFVSDLLFGCGILVFTDKSAEEKLPTIDTSKYIVEGLKSGRLQFGEREHMDVDLFESEISKFVSGEHSP